MDKLELHLTPDKNGFDRLYRIKEIENKERIMRAVNGNVEHVSRIESDFDARITNLVVNAPGGNDPMVLDSLTDGSIQFESLRKRFEYEKSKRELQHYYINVEEFPRLAVEQFDNPRIQRAIDMVGKIGGGVVYLHKSTTINAPIALGDNVCLMGNGVASIITCTGQNKYPAIVNKDIINGNDYISIIDVFIDVDAEARGLLADDTSNGIKIGANDANTCDNLYISGVWIKNTGHAGMYLSNITNFIVSQNLIFNTYRDGIVVWFNSVAGVISDNIVRDCGDDCIALNSEAPGHENAKCRDIVISGGVVSHRNTSIFGGGVRIGGADNITVSDVIVNKVQGHGIAVSGSFVTNRQSVNVNVTNCIVKNSGTNPSASASGIVLSNCIDSSVQGCKVIDFYNAGIYITPNSLECSVHDNHVKVGKKSTSVGIIVDGKINNIHDNKVTEVQGSGITINADSNTVQNNILRNCCKEQTGGAYVLITNSSNFHTVQGNKIIRTQTVYGSYGIRIASGTSNGCFITNNHTINFSQGNGISNGSTGNNSIVNNYEVLAA
ncbi:TPA: right-handed parallel beta-helix repeat-containing protein [Bacillus mobilis]